MTVLMAVSSPHHFKMVMVVVRAVVRVANVIFVGMLYLMVKMVVLELLVGSWWW